ncbi:RHS repeat domain-containing protein [Flavobacterium sp. Root901]|uniref:RHS repeat domain-containing protein n=1 Tax=Flavobacterium sp. Root901 TaxID=1736605 RepID=UPI000A8FE821|nr:RHS repeat domain-containing protein [Flavobacterium sp. Root901]
MFSVFICPLFFIVFSLNAQISENDPAKYVPNMIPPSPTAYGLGNYGNTPVGLFTGSQNINIPLYTYKTANLEVPITMFYSSNGIKVDEISSNVGQSWNLSFGGVITRMVRDKPDEERGQYPIPISITEEMGRYSPPALDFYQYIGENDVDTEADIFSFNFGKYSGKFIFNNEGGINLIPAQELKIEYTLTSESINFVVTTPDGVKYYFDNQEITTQRVLGSGHSIPNISVTSWYLSRIVHPKGDEILFSYDNAVSSYTASQSQTYRMLYPRIQYDEAGNLEYPTGGLSSISDHTINLAGKAIRSIKSTNSVYGEVAFTYLSASSADVTSGNNKISQITIKDRSAAEIDRINFTYTTTANKRVFLDKIQFKDLNQSYQFEYLSKESFPKRLSLSQDHWGYYNGKNNVNIVPKLTAYELESVNYNGADKEPNENFAKIGLLTKIIYPTKGYTLFDYEPNDYYGIRSIPQTPIYKSISAVTTEEINSKTSQSTFTSTFLQNVPLVAGVSFYCLDSNFNIGKNKATLSVYNDTAKRYESLYRSDNKSIVSMNFYQITPNTSSEAKNLYFIAAANQSYTITLTAEWFCTSSSINYNYVPGPPTTTPANIITGGIRVQRTSDYSSSSAEPVIKRFYYAKKDDLTKSTGNKGQDPYYIDRYKVEKILESPGAGQFGVISSATYLNLSSSSLTSLFDTGSSNVFYNYVTISYGSDSFLNGGEEHEFIVHRDGADGFVIGTYDVRSAPFSNLGWDNGLLKKINYFNKDLKIVKQTINEYEERSALRKQAISYSTRKNYEKIASAPVTYQCTTADLTKKTPYWSCVANHTHQILMNEIFFGDGYTCIAPGHDNRTTYITHPCYGATLPKTITNLANIDNISIVAYKNYSFWHYLKSTQEITYDINGANPVSTIINYNYRGINHTLLSSQTSSNSNQETLETKYFYPKDAEMATEPFVTDLIAANMTGMPLNTQNFRNTVKLSEQKTGYEKNANTSSLLLPRYMYANKGISAIVTSDKKITFNQYDDKGNILLYTLESGIPVSIIWGYNKTQPIAKIENASYIEVSSYVSNLQNLSNTGTESDLIKALNSLRAAVPNAMVTTYTHIPLIGISTITDPKGQTTTYSYDSFGRLEFVKDNNGNILSENQYNYKP